MGGVQGRSPAKKFLGRTTRSGLQGVQTTFSFLAGLHIEPIVPKLIRMGMPRAPLRKKLQEKTPQWQTLVA